MKKPFQLKDTVKKKFFFLYFFLRINKSWYDYYNKFQSSRSVVINSTNPLSAVVDSGCLTAYPECWPSSLCDSHRPRGSAISGCARAQEGVPSDFGWFLLNIDNFHYITIMKKIYVY